MNEKGKLILLVLSFTLLALIVGYYIGKKNTPKDGATQHSSAPTKAVYTCPMHPSVISDHPDKCPICGMDLQLIDGNEGATLNEEESASTVEGRSSFSLSQERQQLIGVTSAKVEKLPLVSEVRASGKVAFDPELYTAIEEYRQAIFSSKQMQDSNVPTLKEQANELIESSKLKLRLLGLTPSQIDQLQNNKASSTELILPKGKVWVYGEIYEYEMGNVKVGQNVEVTAPAISGKLFSGKVSSISPVLNSQSRTVRVRVLVPDPEGELRPDTFVNVKINIETGEKIAIPQDSVLHSGEQTFVFVMKDKGRFEPREVKLGNRNQDMYEVISGLTEGETIVTSANFLIDSESKLRSAIKKAGSHNHD